VIRCHTTVALLVAALGVLPGAAFADSPPPSANAPRPIAALSESQRLYLPDSTQVIVLKGKVTTLGALRTLHKARVASAANAAALGRQAALLISSQHFHVVASGNALSIASAGASTPHTQTFSAMELRGAPVASGVYPGIIFRGSIPTPTPAPKLVHQAVPGWWQHVLFGPSIVPLSPAALQKYAKDYQSFCTAAQATVCIYLPSGVSAQNWETGGYTDPNTNYVYDYLIVDPTVCQAGGGTMDQGSCRYAYPALSLTNFVPSASNPYAVNCPGGMYSSSSGLWIVILDPHGAAEAQFVPIGSAAAWPGASGSSPLETCVVQVFTS
jgi:hypothetical protein